MSAPWPIHQGIFREKSTVSNIYNCVLQQLS